MEEVIQYQMGEQYDGLLGKRLLKQSSSLPRLALKQNSSSGSRTCNLPLQSPRNPRIKGFFLLHH